MIPFKKNSTATSKGAQRSEVWARLFDFFSLHREEFLGAYHLIEEFERQTRAWLWRQAVAPF